MLVVKFTDEQYTTINQSIARRFDLNVFVNCLLVSSGQRSSCLHNYTHIEKYRTQILLLRMIFVGLGTESCIAKSCAYAVPPFREEMEECSIKIHVLDLSWSVCRN